MPSVVGTPALTQESSDSTTHAVNLPTDRASGDQVWVWVSCRGGGSEAIAFPGGGTWTQVVDTNNDVVVGLGWANQSDLGSATTVTVTTTNSRRVAAVAWRVTGADLSSPAADIDTATGNSTTPDPPVSAPAAGSDDYLWVAGFGIDSNSMTPGSVSPPSGYTTVAQAKAQNANISGVAVAAKEATSDTDNPGTFTGTDFAENWVAFTLAIAPSTAALNATIEAEPADASADAPGFLVGTGTTVALPPSTTQHVGPTATVDADSSNLNAIVATRPASYSFIGGPGDFAETPDVPPAPQPPFGVRIETFQLGVVPYDKE